MSGSINHTLDKGRYIGTELLENIGDFKEAVDEMMFVILEVTTEQQRKEILERFYRCARGEELYPNYFRAADQREEGK